MAGISQKPLELPNYPLYNELWGKIQGGIMKLNALIPKSKVFYKVYLWNIAATIIFIVLISMISIGSSTRFILDNTTKFNQETVSLRKNIFDDRIRLLDESINMLVEQDTILEFMFYGDSRQPRPTELRDMVVCLQAMCDNNQMLEGISLIDVQGDIVLNNQAMFSVDELNFDKEKLLQEGLCLEETADGTEIQYIQRFNPLQRKREIFVVLTLDSKIFLNNLLSQKEHDMQLYQEYILAENGKGLSWEGVRVFEPEVLEVLNRLEHGYQSIRSEEYNLLVYKEKSDLLGWSVVWIQDYTSLQSQSRGVMKTIIFSCLFMILVASILIYICTWFLYKPLKQLGSYVKQRIPDNRNSVGDEYRQIEKAVDWLTEENEVISKKYQDTLPLLIQNTVYNLITNEYEEERFQYLKRITGKEMEREYYLLLFCECADSEGSQAIIDLLKVYLEQDADTEGFWAALPPAQTVWLINTDHEYEAMLDCLSQLRETAYPMDTTWYVSKQFKNIQNASLAYFELEKKRSQKFFKGKNILIYEELPKAEKWELLEKRKIQTSILKYMKTGDEQGIRDELHTLKQKLPESHEDVHYICYQYFELCISLLSSLEEMKPGGYSKQEEKEVFRHIFEAGSIEELERITGEILTSRMERYTGQNGGYSDNVEKAVKFIQNYYMRDLSLDDVAGAVYLSGGYLSNIFKAETGDTVFEYITKVRMQKARNLLLENPSMKIKDISDCLGYNNVQSFIRYFKKHYGDTPVEMRKNQETEKK